MTPEPERDPRLPTVSPWAGKSAAEYAASVDQGIAEHNAGAKDAKYQVWSGRGRHRVLVGSRSTRPAAEKLARETKRCAVWSTDVVANPEPMLRVGVKGAERGPWARPPADSPARKLLLDRCARVVAAPDGTEARAVCLMMSRRVLHRIVCFVAQGWAPYRRLRLEVPQRAVRLELEKGRLVVRVAA